MKQLIEFIARALYTQEIIFRGLIVILLTIIMFIYYLLMIPFLHIYKFLKSGLEAVDECNANMTNSVREFYELLKK